MSLRRIKMQIEYDGSPFTGWQRQPEGKSVQGELERALSEILKEPIKVIGSGRTDAGVHALGMIAHCDTSAVIPCRSLPLPINSRLPDAICLLSAEEVVPTFDARRDAILRWYRYQIDLTRRRHPLGPRAWTLKRDLNIDLMREAATRLEGEHDFQGFRASSCEATRTVLNMREVRVTETDGLIAIDFKCRSFLQRMIRLLVGSLVTVAENKLELAAFESIITTGDRPNTIPAAPPEGLCLMAIAYDETEAQNILTDHRTPPSF